jgi:hypothetical protein
MAFGKHQYRGVMTSVNMGPPPFLDFIELLQGMWNQNIPLVIMSGFSFVHFREAKKNAGNSINTNSSNQPKNQPWLK